MSLRETVGALREAMRGPSALQAVRGWVEMGAPESLEPTQGVVGRANRGPQSVELSPAEAAALDELLDAYPLQPAPSDRSSAVHERLIKRGILLVGREGLVLAPDYLWTVGLNAWAARSIRIAGGARTDPGKEQIEFQLAGDRAVRAVAGNESLTLSVVVPAQVETELASRVALPGGRPTRGLEVRSTWQEGNPADYEFVIETVTVTADADGVVWSVEAESQAVPEPVAPEHLTRLQAGDRLRAAVARGVGFDARTVALGRFARSRRYALVRPAQLIPAVDIAAMFVPGGDERLALLELERQRQKAAEEYWHMGVVFTHRRR